MLKFEAEFRTFDPCNMYGSDGRNVWVNFRSSAYDKTSDIPLTRRHSAIWDIRALCQKRKQTSGVENSGQISHFCLPCKNYGEGWARCLSEKSCSTYDLSWYTFDRRPLRGRQELTSDRKKERKRNQVQQQILRPSNISMSGRLNRKADKHEACIL